MQASGNEQWNDEYPKPEIFANDIKEGTLYAMKDKGRLVGIIVLSEKQDKQYEDIDWEDKDGKYLTGHRIAVHPDWHRKGIADRFMDFALKIVREKGYSSMRVDTYHKNTRSQALLEKRGFKRLPGHINFHECTGPFYCYELVLKGRGRGRK